MEMSMSPFRITRICMEEDGITNMCENGENQRRN